MNLFSRKAITIIFICSLFFNLNNSFAKKTKDDFLKLGDNKKIGQAIAEEYDDRDLGFNDQISKMKMILINAYGDKNTRLMEARIFERQDRDIGDKSLLLFFNSEPLFFTL